MKSARERLCAYRCEREEQIDRGQNSEKDVARAILAFDLQHDLQKLIKFLEFARSYSQSFYVLSYAPGQALFQSLIFLFEGNLDRL